MEINEQAQVITENVITEPVRERQLCKICKSRGHDMWIWVKNVTTKDGRSLQIPINWYSQTKHWHLLRYPGTGRRN